MVDSNFSQHNIKLIFKLRTRIIQVKNNFKNGFESLICELCHADEEDQLHLLNCETLLNQCEDLYNDVSVEYGDLFSTTTKQLQPVKLFEKILKVREKLRED